MTGRPALSALPVTDRVTVVCLAGALDPGTCPQLERELVRHLERAARQGRRLVLDMADVRLFSPAACRTLRRSTDHLAHAPVLVVTAAPGVREALRQTPLAGVRRYDTLGLALAALPDPATVPDAPHRVGEAESLRNEVFGMRAKARSSAQIGIAQGILIARYDLPAASAAFTLLRDGSQRHNVPMRVLASAVIAAPPPQSDAHWFPGRTTHSAAPDATFLRVHGVDPADRRRVLTAALHHAVTLADADAAELHLTDPAQADALLLEQHHGLDAAYRDFAALVTGPPAVCAQAQRRREAVHVFDVAEEPGLSADPAGRALLAAGIRAVHSVPLLTARGPCTGALSLHWRAPGTLPARGRQRALGNLAADIAAWRSWYRRTVVLDALEYLHQHRRNSPPEGDGGS